WISPKIPHRKTTDGHRNSTSSCATLAHRHQFLFSITVSVPVLPNYLGVPHVAKRLLIDVSEGHSFGPPCLLSRVRAKRHIPIPIYVKDFERKSAACCRLVNNRVIPMRTGVKIQDVLLGHHITIRAPKTHQVSLILTLRRKDHDSNIDNCARLCLLL